MYALGILRMRIQIAYNIYISITVWLRRISKPATGERRDLLIARDTESKESENSIATHTTDGRLL